MAIPVAEERAASAGIAIERHIGLAGWEAIGPEWQALSEQAVNSTLYGPAWIRAQVLAFEDPYQVQLICARAQGRLLAVLPLVRDRAWYRGVRLRRLRGASGHLCLRYDLTVAPDWSRAVAQALYVWLEAWRGWEVLELRHVAHGARAWDLQQAAARAGCPVARWNYCESPYLTPATHSNGSKFRRELARTRRQLAERGPVRLQRHTDLSPDLLEQFFAMEAAGWKSGPGGNAVLSGGPRLRHFYDELAAGMGHGGGLVLHQLLCGDRPVSMSLGVRNAAGYHLVKWVYDEEYSHFGPGHLLIDAMLEECRATACPRFDFTGESSAAKRKWTELSLPHDWLFIFRRSLRGRLVHGLKFGWGAKIADRLGVKR